MENAESEILRRCDLLQSKLRIFSAQDVDENYIEDSEHKKKLKDIEDVFLEIDVNISGLLREYNATMQTPKKEWWEARKKSIFDEVKIHERLVRAAVIRVKGNLTGQTSNCLGFQESNESEAVRGCKRQEKEGLEQNEDS